MSTKPLVNSRGYATRLAVPGFMALGSLLRILSYFYSENTGGDAGAHVALAAQWLQHPVPKVIFDVYPPGHFWLMGATALLVHDVFTAGRLLSLVLGIGSLFIVWKLAEVLYGELAAVCSLAVFSLYSLHIGYSTTSSAEVSYLFFLLLGLLFFFAYLQKEPGQLSYLWMSGLSISVSESIRYEAWIFFFGMFVTLVLIPLRRSRRGRNVHNFLPAAIFGIAGGAWPAFMMTYSWYRFRKPMYLVNLNSERVQRWLTSSHTSLSHQLALTPVVLILSLSLPAFVAAVYALCVTFRLRLAAIFAALVVFFGLIQFYQITRGALEATARYTLTLGTMFAVLSGYGIERLCHKLAPARVGLARAVVVICLFLNLGMILYLSESHSSIADTIASISPRLRYSRRIAGVGEFLRAHRTSQDAVVIDNYNVESNIIANAAGLPLVPGRLEYLASVKNQAGVLEYIHAERPRFLVYSGSGTLQQWIHLPPECDRTIQTDGIQFTCEYSNQIYRIYELSYP